MSSLYDRLGGEKAVNAAVELFYPHAVRRMYRPLLRGRRHERSDRQTKGRAGVHIDIKNAAIFICGGEKLVKQQEHDFFMRGASLKNIRSNSFTPAAQQSNLRHS